MRDALRLAAFQLLFLDRVPAYAAVDDSVTLATPHEPPRRRLRQRRAPARRRGRTRAAGRARGGRRRARLGGGALVPALAGEAAPRRTSATTPARRLLEAANAAPERCLRANRLRGGLPAARRRARRRRDHDARRRGPARRAPYDGPPLERSASLPRRTRDGAVARARRSPGIVAAGGVSGPEAAVLDLCAAPGAKTSQLAALLPGAAITAVEVDEDARRRPAPQPQRASARTAVDVVRADALEPHPEWEGAFDAVLLDAPCSGLGTLASRADLRWRRHLNDVPRLAQLQARLLARAAAAVKPGGALTYAVCTLTRAETLGVVEPLLAGGRLDGRRPRRSLAGPGAPGGRRLPARAAARRRLQRVLRRPPAARGSRRRASTDRSAAVDYRCGTRPRRRRIGGTVEDILRGINVAPSILSADFSRLGEDVEAVLNAGARVIHVDVMDGHFVPNITIGPLVVKALQPLVHGAGALLDVHLMIERPESTSRSSSAAGADVIVVHQEACTHLHRVLTPDPRGRRRWPASRSIPRRRSRRWPRPGITATWCSSCRSTRVRRAELHPDVTDKIAPARAFLPDRGHHRGRRRRDASTTPARSSAAGANWLVAGSSVVRRPRHRGARSRQWRRLPPRGV